MKRTQPRNALRLDAVASRRTRAAFRAFVLLAIVAGPFLSLLKYLLSGL